MTGATAVDARLVARSRGLRLGPRGCEWLVAAIVLLVSAWASQQVRACAGELDGAVEARRRQIVQLGELMGAPVLPAMGMQPLTGLFADHDVVVGTTAWGRQLELRPHIRTGRQ